MSGQDASLDRDDLIGRVLGGYRIIRCLGRGGMGIVFEARQENLGRKVALKVLPPDLARDKEFIARFRQEAMAAAALKHPGIVPIYDVGQDDGYEFYSMELVEGQSLADYLQEHGRMPPDRSVKMVGQVAAALEHARRANIVHRDIKPSNILIEKSGRVRIVDLGLAKAAVGTSVRTRSTMLMGTPHYMSPEQFNNPRDVDTRADIYSLGITWYHTLTGTRPFRGDTPLELMNLHCNAPLPPLDEVCPETPADVTAIIEKMTAKKVEHRFQTPRDLMRALKAYLDREKGALQRAGSQTVVNESPIDSLPNIRRIRLPREWVAAGAVVVVPAVAVLLWFVLSPSDSGSPSPGQTRNDSGTARVEGAQPRDQRSATQEDRDTPESKSWRDYSEIARRADEAVQEGNYTRALQVLSAQPDTLTEEDRRALAKKHDQFTDEAGKLLEEAIEKSRTLENQGQFEEAIRTVEKAAKVDLSGGQKVAERVEAITHARAAKAAESAEKEMRALWRKRIIPLIAEGRYDDAVTAFDEIRGELAVAPGPEALKRFSGQLEALRAIGSGIQEYAAELDADEEVQIHNVRGAFQSYADGTFTVKVNDRLVERAVGDLPADSLLSLARKGLPADDPAPAVAEALLSLYVPPADLEKAQEALESAGEYPDGTGRFAPALNELNAHLQELRRARRQATALKAANSLYAEASAALDHGHLFRCRAALGELTRKYPDTPWLKDGSRSDHLKEMRNATSNLGQYVTVSRSGRADFRTIQEAVTAVAEPNSLIEVLDQGVYRGPIVVEDDARKGLVILGRGPELTAIDGIGKPACIRVEAENVIISGFMVMNATKGILFSVPGGKVVNCALVQDVRVGIEIQSSGIDIRNCAAANCMLYSQVKVSDSALFDVYVSHESTLENTAVFGSVDSAEVQKSCSLFNCLVTGDFACVGSTDLDQCTVRGSVLPKPGASGPLTIRDSITGALSGPPPQQGISVRNSNIFAQRGSMPPGKFANVFRTDPGFANPLRGDFRLRKDSPCRGKASHGGDLGCHFTPGLTRALELAGKWKIYRRIPED